MRDLRVAVLGQGLIGRQRAAALESVPGARLVATVDPRVNDPGHPRGVAHFADFAELQPGDYDAAVVAVPHHVAGDLVAGVISAGKPVLVEKPLGVTATQARTLEQMSDKVELPSFVGYNYRFLPTISRLLSLIGRGELGTLRSVDMLIGHGGHPGSACGWKLDPARAGGGVLLDPGVHLLDLLLRIAPEITCSGAEATSGFWGTGVEEDVSIIFRAENLIASLRVSHIRWINTFRAEVFGEHGYAIAEGRGGNYGPMTLRVGRRWGWTEHNGVSQRETEDVQNFGIRDDSLRDELRAVVEVWRGGEVSSDDPHPATMSEARAVTDVCDQLYSRIGRD